MLREHPTSHPTQAIITRFSRHWLACDRSGVVVPPPAESELSAALGLAAGDRCPVCAARPADPNARGVLRPATPCHLGRRAGG